MVLDSSITLSWYFEDERTEASRAVLNMVAVAGAVVPSLWRFEVANALQIGVRRKRIGEAFRDRALRNLSAMAIEIDPECETHAWSASVQLAERHGLTVYDASYLELAQRRRLTLATLDRALIRAGEAERVAIIGS